MPSSADVRRSEFAGELTARDGKRHLMHRFSVPAGIRALKIAFRFEPVAMQGFDNMLSLTLFDPHGFRGARHRGGSEHRVSIDARSATPGYLPGPLPPGEWTVQIDTHRIMPGAALKYWLTVESDNDRDDETARTASSAPAPMLAHTQPPRRGPGWVRGDLHSHTDHSDAGDRTVADLIASAQAIELDFLFITDHNTTSSLIALENISNHHELLVGRGMELTTFWGHALVLGARTWIDWRIRPGDGGLSRIAQQAYTADQLFIIAHPSADGDPYCTGCAWRFGEMMPGAARLVEVWNGPWSGESNNEAALALWYDWLNQGQRLVATVGSDTHSATDYAAGPGFAVVYTEELSEAALLRAIAAGHLYLSSGPALLLEATTADGKGMMMGDRVAQAAHYTVTWQHCPSNAEVRVLANGNLLHRTPAILAPENTVGIYTWSMTPHDATWVAAEVRDAAGALLAVTNPIYLELHAEDQPPATT